MCPRPALTGELGYPVGSSGSGGSGADELERWRRCPRSAVSIHQYIVTYGYAAVFVGVGIESFGVPLPGETALVAAAAYAGATHRLNPWFIFAVAVVAAVGGGVIGYWIGDRGGYRLLRRWGRYVRLDEPKVKVARYLFDRHGGKVIFFGRFVSVLRTYAPFLAGTLRMRYRRFLVADVAGGVLWAAIYTLGGYFAGRAITSASEPVAIGGGIVAVLVIVAALVILRKRMNDLVDKGEAAYPGPLERD